MQPVAFKHGDLVEEPLMDSGAPFFFQAPGGKEPDQVYEGITFDDFLKIWEGINIETKMHVCFLTLEPMVLCY